MKRVKNRLILLLAVATVLLFFSNDFGLIDIEKTAIIVALAVDYEKETEIYEVTAQIAIPEATDQSASNENSLIDGRGKTIAEAIDEIGLTSGWYPKLSFCNLVVLGESLLENNLMDSMDYFVRTDKMQDAALLVTCEGKARDCLATTTPLDSISSFALQKIIVKDVAHSERIAVTNVTTFVKNHYSLSGCSYMPLIRKKKVQKTAKGNQGSALTAAEEEQSGTEENYVFDATQTVVFQNGIKKCVLNESETLVFNLTQRKNVDTYFPLEEVSVEGKPADVLLHLSDSDRSFSLDLHAKPTFTIRLTVYCQFEDVDKNLPVSELTPVQEVSEEILEELKKRIEDVLREVFRKTGDAGCDLFRLKERLYKFHFPHYREYEDDLLLYADMKAEIKVVGERKLSTS